MLKTFDHLLLLGRPAAGKSEFIDFMKKTEETKRAQVFHIGKIETLDDFHWLWEKFLEDDLWEEAGFERQFSERLPGNYAVRKDRFELYDLMMAKFNHTVGNQYLSQPEFYNDHTLIIEFSRGRKDGYKNALGRLSPELLKRTVIFYVKVDFEESWRRNVARYQEKLKSSTLFHMVTKETMEYMYAIDDWDEITGRRESGTISLQGINVPFVTMNNVPELKDYDLLAARYEPYLNRLMELAL